MEWIRESKSKSFIVYLTYNIRDCHPICAFRDENHQWYIPNKDIINGRKSIYTDGSVKYKKLYKTPPFVADMDEFIPYPLKNPTGIDDYTYKYNPITGTQPSVI